MKIINHIIPVIITLLITASCVQDDDFDVPNALITEPSIDGQIIDIDAVLGAFNQSDLDVITFSNTNSYMEGYVISSDEAGNFFEELVLQDKPENPTAGIVVQIDVNPLFTIYEFGRKVYVKLDGLSVAIENGVIQIGRRDGNQIEKIAASQMSKYIIRTTEIAEIIPLKIDISEFSGEKENLYIQLDNIQFNRNEVLFNPKTFASEDGDQFDGERLLESCTSNRTFVLSTSTFSDFKFLQLPKGSGSLSGILTRDFYDDFYTVYVNSPEDIVFESSERCDPTEISCGLSETVGTTNIFFDDFESQRINTPINGNGWTNFIEAGTESWEAYRQTGTNASQGISGRIDSSGSGNDSSIAWLITPEINLDAYANVTLEFQTSNSFADNSILQVLISEDWDGNESTVNLANWDLLSDAVIVNTSDFFGDWIRSGKVGLSCASGKVHIAFKYIGSGQSNFDGVYELDMISINAD